jgi:predicted phage terminase large subunit-like protein
LAGRILNGTEQWKVLSLPAIDMNGRALWADQYDLPALERIKGTIGPREWSALYQQQPQADEGSFFKKDWFKRWTDLPVVRVYGTSDYAVSDGRGDWTVLRIWGISASGGIYLLDGWRGQSTADVWIERQCELIRKWKPLCWVGEAGVIQKAVEPMLLARMRSTGARVRLEWLPSINDKATRARGFQSRAAMGEVWLPHGGDGDLVLDELARFPAGKHDDEVDAASLIGRALDMAHPAMGQVVATNVPGKRDYGLRRTQESDSWTTV